MNFKELTHDSYVLIPGHTDESKPMIPAVIAQVKYFNGPMVNFGDHSCKLEFHFKNIYPIPITKELLEKTYYEKDGKEVKAFEAPKHLYYIAIDNHNRITVDPHDSHYWISDNEGNEIYSCNDLKGFHHLQRIVFDLSGIELKIRLKECDHNIVSAKNEVVKNGMYCTKCGRVFDDNKKLIKN